MALKIFILLQIFVAATAHSDQVGRAALAVKGKDCIAIVEKAYTDITNGYVDSASEKLKSLKSDAEELARIAEEKAQETERLERKYKQEAEKIQREISNLHVEANRIGIRKSELEITLKQQRSMLSEYETQRENAQNNFNIAQRRLREAKSDKNTRRGVGAGIGAIVGTILFPGVGTFVGAGLGLGTGQIINELSDDEERAKRHLNRAVQQYEKSKSDIDSTNAEISKTTNEIYTLQRSIQDLERQRSPYNSDATKMKEVMQFFVRASYFWKEFGEVSEHGADRTAFLQRIIKKAKETESLDFLKSRGTERTVMTFLEAWEMMVNKYMKGSDFVPQISRGRSEL